MLALGPDERARGVIAASAGTTHKGLPLQTRPWVSAQIVMPMFAPLLMEITMKTQDRAHIHEIIHKLKDKGYFVEEIQ